MSARGALDLVAAQCQTSGMAITTLRLPDELLDRVKQQAEREHRSVNGQIVHILERATDAEESQP